MRYTVENTTLAGKHAQVFLDGKELKKVIECDTVEGYAIVYREDADGNLFRDGDEIARETLHGKITVKMTRRR